MSIDDELLQDAADDARAVAYIRTRLPQELQEAWDDDMLYYLLDVIVDYYAESGVLDAEADADGYVEIDQEAAAAYLAAKARKEGIGALNTDDLLLFVEAQLDYEEGLND